MNRAAAMTAASALCLLWTAGCASTSADSSKTPVAAKPADAMPDPHADLATLAKNLPATLDGEIQRAQLLRTKGDYDEAARSLAQIMLVAPDDARVVGEYGKVLEQQGHSKEALPFLKRAVQLQPTDWSVQSALGVAYDQVDDHANARAAYEHALTLKPAEPSILNNYAVSRMLAGDYAGARRLLDQAQAHGAADPKIAGNLEKLAALAPPPAPPKTPTIAPQPSLPHSQSPAVVAAAPKSSVVAGAMAHVDHVPASVTARDTHAAPNTRIANAGPKALGAPVVMQRVPRDPMAGPVHTQVTKTASVKTPKAVLPAGNKPPAQPVTPSLRTAADSN